MRDESYINIQGWMVQKLGLKGNDLLVYAIIYGFSQDGESMYTGSLQYLADWCGATKQGIQKNLKNLLDKELIVKETYNKNGLTFCTYYTSELHTMQLSCMGGMQLSCTNNIDIDNIDKPIPKGIGTSQPKPKDETVQETVTEEPKKTKKKNLYDKCLDAINEFTDLPEIQELLIAYLKQRLENKDKPLYGINQWKGMLKALQKASDESYQKDHSVGYCEVITQSIERNWLSFYPLKDSTYDSTGKRLKKLKTFGETDDMESKWEEDTNIVGTF